MSRNVDYLEAVVMWLGRLLVIGAVVFIVATSWGNANAMMDGYSNESPAVTEVR